MPKANRSVDQLTISMDQDFEQSVGIGISAQIPYDDYERRTIADSPARPFIIPHIISVVPHVAVDAKVKYKVRGNGHLWIATTARFPGFSGTLDVTRGLGSSSGSPPVFQNTFDANGTIAATVRISLPVTVAVGLSIPRIDYHNIVTFVTEPSASGSVASNTTDTTCPHGISASLALENRVSHILLGEERLTFFMSSSQQTSGCFP